MKKSRLLSQGILIVLISIVACILWFPSSTEAQESYGPQRQCYIVKIISHDNVELISPAIHSYDCVVWLNWSKEETPKIVFTEGKACKLSITARTGFEIDDPSGCFLTKPLNYGETASLMFSGPGVFNYYIEFKGGKKLEGKIEVK